MARSAVIWSRKARISRSTFCKAGSAVLVEESGDDAEPPAVAAEKAK